MVNELNLLAPGGSTGNNTHLGVRVSNCVRAAVQFVVESVGSTPTVTWKVQGSLDGMVWYDMQYVTDATDTAAVAARTVTALVTQVEWLDLDTRFYTLFRLVTSANTNITYRGELYVQH